MQPDLEVIRIGRSESFRAYEHGLPFQTVRWHFHPEYELHHVVATQGSFMVGDFIGRFGPGNLVLTGPNLPHNWVSDVAEVPLRNRVLQFTETLMCDLARTLPELHRAPELLRRSRAGLRFSEDAAQQVGPRLAALVHATGIRRIELFLGIIACLAEDDAAEALTTPDYATDPAAYMTSGMNAVLAHINANLTDTLAEDDLSRIAGLSRSAFCRSFKRHTGTTLVRYVNRLRIGLAAHMLIADEAMPVTEICFASGFNNLSNFNRQFAACKGMPPSRFRAELSRSIRIA